MITLNPLCNHSDLHLYCLQVRLNIPTAPPTVDKLLYRLLAHKAMSIQNVLWQVELIRGRGGGRGQEMKEALQCRPTTMQQCRSAWREEKPYWASSRASCIHDCVCTYWHVRWVWWPCPWAVDLPPDHSQHTSVSCWYPCGTSAVESS